MGSANCLFNLFFQYISKTPYATTYSYRIIYSSHNRVFRNVYNSFFLIAYILYTPEDNEAMGEGELEENASDEHNEGEQEGSSASSTVEFQDESSEEIAQVVRTMMSREDHQQVNA